MSVAITWVAVSGDPSVAREMVTNVPAGRIRAQVTHVMGGEVQAGVVVPGLNPLLTVGMIPVH